MIALRHITIEQVIILPAPESTTIKIPPTQSTTIYTHVPEWWQTYSIGWARSQQAGRLQMPQKATSVRQVTPGMSYSSLLVQISRGIKPDIIKLDESYATSGDITFQS